MSSHEHISINRKFRRQIKISGLKNAEVFVFPEDYCKKDAVIALHKEPDDTPVIQRDWEIIDDVENGVYLHKTNVSGSIWLCMPHKDRM